MNEPFPGLGSRDRFIAGPAVNSALLVQVFEGSKEKRNLRREHAPGVPSWVEGEADWTAAGGAQQAIGRAGH